MYLFKNGDRCPCCGQVIEGKYEDWLLLFSQTVHALGLDPSPTEHRPRPWLRNYMVPTPNLGQAAREMLEKALAEVDGSRGNVAEPPSGADASLSPQGEGRAAEGVGPYEGWRDGIGVSGNG